MATKTKPAAEGAADKMKLKAGKAHVVVLCDESGSMGGLTEAVVTGANSFLGGVKDRKKTRVTVATFDACAGEPRVRFPREDEKARECKPITAADYKPRGGTPLFDAVLETIDTVSKRVDDNDAVFMTVITDGGENSSEVKDPKVVAEVVRRFKEKGWAFLYVGANQNAQVSAALIGLTDDAEWFSFTANREQTANVFLNTSSFTAGYLGEYDTMGSAAEASASSLTLRSSVKRAGGQSLGAKAYTEADLAKAKADVDLMKGQIKKPSGKASS